MGHFYYKSPEKPDEIGFLNYRIMYRNWRGKELFAKEIKVPTCGLEESARTMAFIGINRQVDAANTGLEKIPGLRRLRMTAAEILTEAMAIGQPIIDEIYKSTDRKLAAETDMRNKAKAPATQVYGSPEKATPKTQLIYEESPGYEPTHTENSSGLVGLESAVETPGTIAIEADQAPAEEHTGKTTYVMDEKMIARRRAELSGTGNQKPEVQIFDMNDAKERDATTKRLFGEDFE